jgi:hypothetical protein
VGALAWGPKTVKETVPVGLEPPLMLAAIEEVAIVVPAVPVAGALTLSVGETLGTMVSLMPEPQVLVAPALLVLPL